MSEAEMMFEYELEEEEQGRYHICDDGAAGRAFAKIRAAKAYRDQKLAWYNRQIEMAIKECDYEVARQEGLLREYFESVPVRKTAKTQESYKIPGATLVLKYESKEYVHDDGKLLEWLKANGRDDLIKVVTVEKPKWKEAKAEMQDTGEIMGGVSIETVPSKFVVKED